MFLTDRYTLDSSNRTKTSEGYLIVPGKVSRTGIQTYYGAEIGFNDRAEELISVYRAPEQVFDAESMASIKHKPVTNDHPPVLVNSENIKDYQVGSVLEDVQQVDDAFIAATLQITDEKTIKRIERGEAVELSVGYTSNIEREPGHTKDGVAYDAIQTDIRANHVAIVSRGRCGSACSISDEEPDMPSVTINDVEFEASKELASAVKVLQKQLKDADEKIKEDEDEEEKKKEAMEKDHAAQLDTLQAKLDDAESRIPTPEQLDALVTNRMNTLDAARKINSTFDGAGMDCETIRTRIVKDACPDVDTETASADYIRARFDALVSQVPDKLTEGFKQQLTADSAEVVDADKARKKMIERSRNLWKGDK